MVGQQIRILGVAVAAVLALSGAAEAMDVAKVNGKSISDKELKGVLSGMSDSQRESILKNSQSRRQVLDNLIEQELLTQEAEKEKLDQDVEYKEALNAFRKQFLASRILQKNLADKISEKSAKKYYEGNKDRYSTEQVHALHILVNDEKAAKDLLAKAKEPGTDFLELAEKNSKDPSAKNNRGDLGYFTRDRMVPEFTKAAFDAGENEVVGPVKTGYGFHIIKVVNKKPGKPLEYSEVELRVKNDLRQELIQNFVAKLRTQSKIDVVDEALKKM